MKLFGVILISLVPIIYGAKKYLVLISRNALLGRFLKLFKNLAEQIEYSKNELSYLLKADAELFEFTCPITLNENKTEAINSHDISVLKELLTELQSGDRQYVLSVLATKLKELEKLKNAAEQELTSKGRVYATTFLGISAVVFLTLI